MYRFFLLGLSLYVGLSSGALLAQSPRQPSSSVEVQAWTGEWQRVRWQEGASLEVQREEDALRFALSAFSGSHSGELTGLARWEDSKAYFEQLSEYDSCYLRFELHGDTLRIGQRGFCEAGMGVYYQGDYLRAEVAEALPPPTLLSLRRLQTEAQEVAFRRMVGEHYDKFLAATHLVFPMHNLDDFEAQITASTVRGLAGYLSSVIMFAPQQRLWAAVLDQDRVLYFTNQPEYAERPPLSVQNWLQQFPELEVVYEP